MNPAEISTVKVKNKRHIVNWGYVLDLATGRWAVDKYLKGGAVAAAYAGLKAIFAIASMR